MISLKDLHDATLVSLELDWASGDLNFNFRSGTKGSPTVCLTTSGLTLLKCPREYPWGRSVSVNTARAEELDGNMLLLVEMQSGDVIEAKITKMALALVDSPS
jgi:hypothetical protein